MPGSDGVCSFFKFEQKVIPAVRFPGRQGCWVSALPSHLLGLDRVQLLSHTHQRGVLTCACSENPVRALLIGCCLSWGVFWFRLVNECPHCELRTSRPKPTPIQRLVLTGCVLQQGAIKGQIPLNRHQERFAGWRTSSLCLYGGVFWDFETKSKEPNENIWSVGTQESAWALVTRVGTFSKAPAESTTIRVLPLACLATLCLQNPFTTFMEPHPILGPRADFKNDGDWEKVRFILLPLAETPLPSRTAHVLTTKLDFLPTVSLSTKAEEAFNPAQEWGFLQTLAAHTQSRIEFAWNIQKIRVASNLPSKEGLIDVIPATCRRVSKKIKLPPLVLCTTQAHLKPPAWQEQAFYFELGKSASGEKDPASLKDKLGLTVAGELLRLCLHDCNFFLGREKEGFEFVLTLCHQKTGFYPCCADLLQKGSVSAGKINHHRDCYFHPTRKGLWDSQTAWWELRRFPCHSESSAAPGQHRYSQLLRFPTQMVILNGRVLETTRRGVERLKVEREGTLQLLLKGMQPHLTCVDLDYLLVA